MNSMQMYDNVLTESTDLISLSKDKTANSICSWLSLWFLFNLFLFSLIKLISVEPLVSQLFLHFGALPIQITSHLLPSKLPSSISSPTQFLVSFLTPFQTDFLQTSASQASALGGFSFTNTLKEKLKLPLGLSIWYHSASDQLWLHQVSVVLLLQIWSWTPHVSQQKTTIRELTKEGRCSDVHWNKN